MERLLSIIIPVYNVEPYIPRCLDSIYSQNVDEDQYELVIVNDGSQDNSSAVVKRYQLKHSNIVLIEKENGGVSSARNLAIKECNGRHLVFVDPDDALMNGALNALITFIRSNQKESVVVMRSFNNEQVECYKWNNLFKNNSHIDTLETINKGYVRGSVCGCCFKRDFIVLNHISFPEGIKNSEDTIFFFHCISLTKVFVFEDIKFYNILGRDDSASRVYSKGRIDSAIESLKYTERLLGAYAHDGKVAPVLNFLKYILISNLVDATTKTEGIGYRYLKQYNLPGAYKANTKGLEYKLFNIKVLNLSFKLFYMLNKIKNR